MGNREREKIETLGMWIFKKCNKWVDEVRNKEILKRVKEGNTWRLT